MTSNLLASGVDFDALFEAGEGNQLLNIYASDGTDIGQKYLNSSEGDMLSTDTKFLASDGSDIRTKLCAYGTSAAGITYKVYSRRESKEGDTGDFYRAALYIEVISTKSKACTVSGTFSHVAYKDVGTIRDPKYSAVTVSWAFESTISESGTVLLEASAWASPYMVSTYGTPVSFSGTIVCGKHSASFNDANPTGSF